MEQTQKASDILQHKVDQIGETGPEEPRDPVDKTSSPPKLNESIDDESLSKINGAQPAPGSIFPPTDFTNPYIALVPKLNRERSKSKENVAGNTLDDLVEASELELKKIDDAKVMDEKMPDFEFLKYHKAEETDESARGLNPAEQVKNLESDRENSSNLEKSEGQYDQYKAGLSSEQSNGQQALSDASKYDKIKNLKSVLQRKPGSAQRQSAALGERRASNGGQKAPIPRGGASPMNLQNQRLLRQRKNSGNAKGVNQSYDVTNTFGGIQGLLRRPASQSSKTSGKGSNNGNRRPPTAKQQRNAMISLTSGGGSSAARGSRKMVPTGKPQETVTPVQPDNDYLETMKQRMKGLPVNTSSTVGIKKNWMQNQPTFDGTKTQDIMAKTIESMVSPKASNANMADFPSDKLSSSAKINGNSQSYSLRAMKRKESTMNSSGKKHNGLANSFATLPVSFDNSTFVDPNRPFNTVKPKSLASKQANLMKATKSSAMRNNLVGQITSKYQTSSLANQLYTIDAIGSSPPKRQNTGKSKGRVNQKASPTRNGSPMSKSKSVVALQNRGVINLRQAEQNFITTPHEEYPREINNINFYTQIEGDNVQNCEELEYQPDEAAEPLTLEGISGMVMMNQEDLRDNGQMKLDASDDQIVCDDDIDKDLKGGESATSAGRSDEEMNELEFSKSQLSPKKMNSSNVTGQPFKPLDIQTISIDSDKLDGLSKTANVEEIQLSQRAKEQRTQKNSEFDSEIMSIIGSINSRAQLIRKKILPKQEGTEDEASKDQIPSQSIPEALTGPKSSSDKFETTMQDPLKDISVDMKDELDLLDDEEENEGDEPKYTTNLDQTIMIGELDDGTDSMFDELKMHTQRTDQSHVSQMLNTKNKGDDEEQDPDIISISKTDLQNMVDNLKIRHRAELDACLIEQGVYKKIVSQMVQKFKQQERQISVQHYKILGLQKYELQAQKYLELNTKLQVDLKFNQNQVDKLKISLIEFDRHMREKVLSDNEFIIQQLETENAHLRKLLNIPEELFKIDPEEEKKKEAEKKRNMLKSIDDKLKRAEQKIQKKQTAAEIYYQNQKEHGIDPFELDQEDYDMFRMSKLKDQSDMPPDVKKKLEEKIYGRMQERSMQEEMRRQHEKDILEEFARVYGYDVNKHQPHNNNGEIDVEYLQAYIAECRAQEEKQAKEKALAKQKEALKGKVSGVAKPKNSPPTNNTGTKSSAPSVKKNLTLETDNFLKDEKDENSGEKPAEADKKEDDDDEFGRDEDSKPMTKEELEKESSNSVGSLLRIGEGEDVDSQNIMHKTLSSTKLQGLFDNEDSGKFEDKEKQDNLNDTLKSDKSGKSADSAQSIGSKDSIVVEDQTEKQPTEIQQQTVSTDSSQSVPEKSQVVEKVEEPATFVDDEEIDEREDLEDDEPEELDEQTKKDLQNLNNSDEASKLKDIVQNEDDKELTQSDKDSMEFEDKQGSDEDDVVKDEQKEILASSTKTPSDQFDYSSSSSGMESGQGQPIQDPYNSQFGQTLQGSFNEDKSMSMTLKGNAGNMFGLSSDEKVKVEDNQVEDNEVVQKGETKIEMDDEEAQLLGVNTPTDKYQEFDDLEEEEDDFNDYDKDNVDHDKPKFNESELIEKKEDDNQEKEISKNVNTVVKEQTKEQPDSNQ